MRDSRFFGVESKQLKNLVPENKIYGGDSRVRTDDLLNAIFILIPKLILCWVGVFSSLDNITQLCYLNLIRSV